MYSRLHYKCQILKQIVHTFQHLTTEYPNTFYLHLVYHFQPNQCFMKMYCNSLNGTQFDIHKCPYQFTECVWDFLYDDCIFSNYLFRDFNYPYCFICVVKQYIVHYKWQILLQISGICIHISKPHNKCFMEMFCNKWHLIF